MSSPRFATRLGRWTAAATVVSAMAACGGSGGPGSSAPVPPPSAPAPAQPEVVLPAPVGISTYVGDESDPGLVDANGRDARFNRIFAMAQGADGQVYVIDQKPETGLRNPVIRSITPGGAVTTLPRGNCYSDPRDVAVGGDGHLYILDDSHGRICRQTLAGVITEVASQPPLTDGASRFTTLARGAGNELYMASRKVLFRLTPGGAPTPVAGQEAVGVSRDGVGAEARFSAIAAIAADSAGNVYVADSPHGIRKVTPQGAVTTLARMELSAPTSIQGTAVADYRMGLVALDDGSVILPKPATGDFNGSLLRRVTPDGRIGTVRGSENLFREIPALARDPSGAITYTGARGVGRLLADGTAFQLAGRGLAGFGQPTAETPLGVDPGGNLVTRESVPRGPSIPSETIRKRSTAGQIVPYAAGIDAIGLPPPDDNVNFGAFVALARDGTLYASYARQRSAEPPFVEFYETEIYKISPTGHASRIYFARRGDAQFAAPMMLAPAPDGTLYFVDAERKSVRRLNTDGTVSAVTADGELGAGGEFSALAVSPAGKVHVLRTFLDRRLYTVGDAGRLVLLAGQVQTTPTATDGAGAQASFINPSPPVFDDQGNAYVLDANALRRITPAGVVTTVAGVPRSGETRIGPLPGSLRDASGLARARDGVFYARSGDAIVRIRLP